MKYIDEFRDGAIAIGLSKKLLALLMATMRLPLWRYAVAIRCPFIDTD